MKKIIFFVFVILSFSCETKLCYKEFSVLKMKELRKEDVLNKDFFNSLKEYKLSAEDIKLTQKLIKKAFKKYNNNLNQDGYKFERLPKYNSYGYLLTPCIKKNNDKTVFINAYLIDSNSCPDLGTLKEWFDVMDGGNSMIKFSINLSQKTTSNIMPNGEA